MLLCRGRRLDRITTARTSWDRTVRCTVSWQVPHDAQPGRSYSFAIDVVQPESCPFKEYEFGDISRAIGGEIAVRLAEAL